MQQMLRMLRMLRMRSVRPAYFFSGLAIVSRIVVSAMMFFIL